MNGESSYRRFISGDKEGLVEIIRDFKDGLILYLCSITGNFHTAEELAEDTFVKLYVDKPAFKGKSSFKTWLYAIGRHTAVDFLRKQQKTSASPLDEMYNVSDGSDIEKSLIQKEEHIVLHRCIQKLNPDYRQVLYLSFFENTSHAETAVIMKRSVRQVTDLSYRAKQALKKEMEKEGYTYEGL